jgi:hypothetical protein
MIGDDILEVKGGVEERSYWVNGKQGHRLLTSRILDFTLGGFSGRFRVKSDHVIQYKIFLPNEQILMIRSVKDMLRVELDNTNMEDFGNSLGLMGTYGMGELMARNGTTIFQEDNTDAFAQSWQVIPSDPQLFHSMEGPQYPAQCTMPTTEQTSRRLRSSISKKDAERACRHVDRSEFKNCVFDVMATDDVQAADGY